MKYCLEPKCGQLVQHGRCNTHQREWDARKRQRRGSAAARGYNRRWRRARLVWLSEHPLCAPCQRQDQIKPATVVDHIIPVTGPADPLFWNTDNWGSKCSACHNRKTAHDERIRQEYGTTGSLEQAWQYATSVEHDSHMIPT